MIEIVTKRTYTKKQAFHRVLEIRKNNSQEYEKYKEELSQLLDFLWIDYIDYKDVFICPTTGGRR